MMISLRSVSLWISIICCAAMWRICHGVVVIYCAIRRSLKASSVRDSLGLRYSNSCGWGVLVTCGWADGFGIDSMRKEVYIYCNDGPGVHYNIYITYLQKPSPRDRTCTR